MKTNVGLAAALLLVLALPLQAQESEKPLEISPFFGYLYGGKVMDFCLGCAPGPPRSNIRYDLADHTTYGLRIGYEVGSHLEPEIQWSHTETGLRSGGTLRLPDICLNTDCLELDYFLGGITYNFTKGRTRPYASLSVGAVRFHPTFSHDLHSSEVRSDTRFAGGLAIGVKTFITPSAGLRFDFHGYASRLTNIRFGPICTTFSNSGPGEPTAPVTAPCPTKEWLINGELSGGLLIAF